MMQREKITRVYIRKDRRAGNYACILKEHTSKESKVEGVIPKKHDKHEKQEILVRPRHQSRRAASKEALKQMQILLEDEDDAVEIPDDDDELVHIPVLSPPKKKYKLTHRKSSDGNDREVLVLKSIPPNITNHNVENNLDLECWVEDLEPCQIERNKKLKEEETTLQNKLNELVKACKGEVVQKGDLTTLIEVSEHVQKTIQAVQASNNKQPNIILNSTIATPQAGYQLVMDPRLGLVLGPVSSESQTPAKQVGKVPAGKGAANVQSPINTSTPSPRLNRVTRGKKQATVIQPAPTPQVTVTTRSTLVNANKQSNKRPAPQTPPPPPPTPPTTRSRGSINVTTPVSKPSSKRGVSSTTPTSSTIEISTPTAQPTTRSSSSANANKPTESSVEGGLAAGSATKSKTVVDLTTDDGASQPDSKEISFNKLQGRTFPSLVVVARPHLRANDVNSDRSKLDSKVKSVLMYQAAKSTEWLIQQGLIKSQQACSAHPSNQLKLGMYSDVTKFPYSGGYVWISECCPQRFVSVFSGSIFESAPHPPLVILKILYHWACQTNIQNVTQWVKVDNLYVKGMYTWLRAVCTVALQSHIRQLGGTQSKVEVGVISLGTTSQDGNSRQVKVEVLGVLETASKLIRLRAIEPLAEGDRNYKKRFSKILEPLGQWVHPGSTIVTDLTVDKTTLHQMGFTNVLQSTSSDSGNSNKTIMEYLRRIVPRMFQNTLSLLSRQIIQQFLDELVWREWFGTTSMQAFDNLVAHLAEQTRYESNNVKSSLIVRLNRVASNPFKNWGIPSKNTVYTPAPVSSPAKPVPVEPVAKKRKRKDGEAPKAPQPVIPEVNRPPKSTSPDVPEQMVPLENYYYGTIDNYPPKTNVTLNMKCPFCKEMFNNNIVLMNHLFKHAHNVSKDGQMCRYCLASVPTANDLLKHIASSHPVETKHDNGFVCLICETHYMNPFVLGKHMSKEHCPSELPYQCSTCGFRCSNHKQVIDHFYKQHDNGPTIQCPFCLKSTTVFSSSRNIVQNMTYFIQHLQKHQKKQFARRCGKCNLWFVQKDFLKEHQMKMHASQRGKTGLIPWMAPRNGVMVPKSKMDKYPCDAEGINFNTLYFNLSKNLKCKECDMSMDSPKHFPSFESCQNPNCQYSTCCSNAMQEHNAKCSKSSQTNIPDSKLPYDMFCVCGYSNDDGNQMARHLAICERKSAYPSVGDAKSASVTHSMLDVLGLVRKPEEADKKQISTLKPDKKLISTMKPDDVQNKPHEEAKEAKPVERRTLKPAPKKIKRIKLDKQETELNESKKEEIKTNESKLVKEIDIPEKDQTSKKSEDISVSAEIPSSDTELKSSVDEPELIEDQKTEEVKEKEPDLSKPSSDLETTLPDEEKTTPEHLREEPSMDILPLKTEEESTSDKQLNNEIPEIKNEEEKEGIEELKDKVQSSDELPPNNKAEDDEVQILKDEIPLNKETSNDTLKEDIAPSIEPKPDEPQLKDVPSSNDEEITEDSAKTEEESSSALIPEDSAGLQDQVVSTEVEEESVSQPTSVRSEDSEVNDDDSLNIDESRQSEDSIENIPDNNKKSSLAEHKSDSEVYQEVTSDNISIQLDLSTDAQNKDDNAETPDHIKENDSHKKENNSEESFCIEFNTRTDEVGDSLVLSEPDNDDEPIKEENQQNNSNESPDSKQLETTENADSPVECKPDISNDVDSGDLVRSSSPDIETIEKVVDISKGPDDEKNVNSAIGDFPETKSPEKIEDCSRMECEESFSPEPETCSSSNLFTEPSSTGDISDKVDESYSTDCNSNANGDEPNDVTPTETD